MTLQAQTIVRKFKYNGMRLVDPSPEKTVDQVKSFYALQFPELLNSEVEGPVTKNGEMTYTFVRAAGSKG
jgi:PRTRC genetic system protein C